MEAFLSILVGIGLSAACGFRVFVPLLIVSIAAATGHLTLTPGWEWIGSTPALISFSVATALEIGAYCIPWVDNVMDAAAAPAAVVAGTMITASFIGEMNPFMKWSLALIAGGGVAGVVQLGTTALRAMSTTLTGGLANPAISTVEAGGSLVLSLMALLVPILTIVLVLGVLVFAVKKIAQWRTSRRESHAAG